MRHSENTKISSLSYICITTTLNNTILNVTDMAGNTLLWASAGSVGFKGSKRSTSYAAQATAEKIAQPTSPLKGEALTFFKKGHEVYSREGHCITCHQSDGKGLPAAMFPPLAGTKWINGSEERLIKLTLHGLLGPIEVKGKKNTLAKFP